MRLDGDDEACVALVCRASALVLEWAAEHRHELLENWNLCSGLKHPKRIKPLR